MDKDTLNPGNVDYNFRLLGNNVDTLRRRVLLIWFFLAVLALIQFAALCQFNNTISQLKESIDALEQLEETNMDNQTEVNRVNIGGHRGLDVFRLTYKTHSLIEKRANHDKVNSGPDFGKDLFEHNVQAIQNETRMLEAMEGSTFTPMVLSSGDDFVVQADAGDSRTPDDMEAYRRNCVKMLATIRARNIRHGDLTGSNIINQGDWPIAIDWQEGHFLDEPAPQKQPFSDSFLLMRHLEGTLGPDGQADTPRVARRWRAILGDLAAQFNFTLPLRDKTFLDLGCFQGDFVALAAAEGMTAVGIDAGGFRSGENSIEIGYKLWRDFPFGKLSLANMDIMNIKDYRIKPPELNDVTMMFSTWPYIVNHYGMPKAWRALSDITKATHVLYFETQLHGDGPGIEAIKTPRDVEDMFSGMGTTAKPIITIPVTGRPAERTVFRVTRNDAETPTT